MNIQITNFDLAFETKNFKQQQKYRFIKDFGNFESLLLIVDIAKWKNGNRF